MSEIKGQLLGIVLVLLIFGIVAGTLSAVFTNLSNAVHSEVNDVISSMKALPLLTHIGV